jgi:hypothetical protein
MIWTPPPSGKRGHWQQFSDAAIQTCLMLKVLFGIMHCQTTGFFYNLLRMVGLDWTTPDFSTLCRRQRTLNVSLPHHGSTVPLNLLIDSIGIDEETLEVRVAEVTFSNIGDAPMLSGFSDQIPSDKDIDSISAEGAYNTCKCHEAIAAKNTHAVATPRKNAKLSKRTNTAAIDCNDAVHTQRYLGCKRWRHWSRYNRRGCI